MKIVVVDDHPVVLEGMSNILSQLTDIAIVAKCPDAIAAMHALRSNQVDIVLSDINLPEINGIELCKRVTSEFPLIKVIGMSTFHDPGYVSEMIKAGGSGFITKNATIEEIESALRGVMKGEIIISHLLTAQKPITFSNHEGPVVTRREKEVLVLISEGLTNKEIADKLFVSLSTIDSHRKNLLTKFNVMNTAALISQAMKKGVI
jgi:two-component system nitrate/nitrite response regulator NarL